MEKKILTKKQEKIIQLIAETPELKNFYLSGGTALAGYYLHHRYSDDLDFFTEKKINSKILYKFIEKAKRALGSKEVKFEKLYDRYQFFLKNGKDELKLEFALYPFHRLKKTKIIKNIKIDSFRDISANKLMAMLERFDPKDFVDLFFILKKRNLDAIRKDVEKKFGIKIEDIYLGGELSKVRGIEALPKMIKKITIEELKDFFSEIAEQFERKIFDY